MVLLFDVDGTLFLTDDPLFGRALVAATRDVCSVDLPPDALSRLDHPGQTTLAIGRALGLAGDLRRWCATVAERYLELLASADASGWRAAEGAAGTLELLSRSARLALLTGNPEPVARARVERLGLARFFPAGQGAFGCEAEPRPELIRLALERAGETDAVAVGDTPADVAGARAAGIAVVAIASGRLAREELDGADAVVSRLADLPAALAGLRRAPA
jgi:HAD superfamily hydrolase (TIGR01549 family)